MSNLSIHKVRKLRHGQVYYRVWGWPVRDVNAAAWGRPCPRIDGVHFHMERCAVWKVGDEPSGSVMGRYFTNAPSAQRFLDEIFAGLHPAAISEATAHAEMCDELDAGLAQVAMVDWPGPSCNG